MVHVGLEELPILVIGAFGLAIVIERVHALFFRYRLDGKDFLSRVEALVMEDRIEEAVRYSSSQKGSLLPGVVQAGLLRASWDDAQVLNAIEMANREACSEVSKRTGYLAMIANVATLLGLLGTIAGLIKAFKSLAGADAATKQALLADGISQAMNHTAMGLAVAIPTMIAFSVLTGRSHKLIEELEQGGTRIFDALSTRLFRQIAEETNTASANTTDQNKDEEGKNKVVQLKGVA